MSFPDGHFNGKIYIKILFFKKKQRYFEEKKS